MPAAFITASPYLRLMRLHQITGMWFLLWPCWWSIALASREFPNLWLMFLFGIGAVVMRGAGCVVNDLFDRKFDAQVERTRLRPLASGELSVMQALCFLALLLLIGLAVLLQLNMTTILLGCAALVPVTLYPLMKRITYWPQAFLGLTFNWGALMGWTAVTGTLSSPAIALYIGGIFWTLGYDTIYGHQDKKDDVQAGVKSTALKLANKTPLWVSGFYTIALLCFTLAGFLADLHISFFAVMLLAAYQCYWQVKQVNLDNPQDCMRIFRSNIYLGVIIFAAIMVGKLI